jgi:hypothetical protein
MKRAVALALLLLTFTAGPVMAAIAWRNATTNDAPEHQLAVLIVAEHERVCGSSLANDTRLVWTARYRATDMVLNDYFAHRNPWTQRRVFDHMRAAGITYAGAAEIIAWNSYPDDLSPGAAFVQFMDSASHRGAIQACAYTHRGVGAYKAGTKRMYVVVFRR